MDTDVLLAAAESRLEEARAALPALEEALRDALSGGGAMPRFRAQLACTHMRNVLGLPRAPTATGGWLARRAS